MTVKVKLQIYLILLAFFLLLMSTILGDFSIGKIWFYLNGNSLVGIHSIAEEISNAYKFGIFFFKTVIFLLDLNIFFLFGTVLLLISFLIFI